MQRCTLIKRKKEDPADSELLVQRVNEFLAKNASARVVSSDWDENHVLINCLVQYDTECPD